MAKKVVTAPKGMYAQKFSSNSTGTADVVIVYRMRNKLGRILRIQKKKSIKTPKGLYVSSIHNHKPRVTNVTIVYKKLK